MDKKDIYTGLMVRAHDKTSTNSDTWATWIERVKSPEGEVTEIKPNGDIMVAAIMKSTGKVGGAFCFRPSDLEPFSVNQAYLSRLKAGG
jgi:hypothetical protein